MRALVALTLLVALTACSGDDAEARWPGPSELRADGEVSIDGFDDYAADVDEPWERSPALVAAEFLRLDEQQAPETTIAADTGPEGGGPAHVTVTLDRLLDDSVRMRRYELELSRDGDTWRLDGARWAQACRPGRGHEDPTPEPCV
jgi:hypothetical protein